MHHECWAQARGLAKSQRVACDDVPGQRLHEVLYPLAAVDASTVAALPVPPFGLAAVGVALLGQGRVVDAPPTGQPHRVLLRHTQPPRVDGRLDALQDLGQVLLERCPAVNDLRVLLAPLAHDVEGLLGVELDAGHELGDLLEGGRAGSKPQAQVSDLAHLPLVLGHLLHRNVIQRSSEVLVQIGLGRVGLEQRHGGGRLPQEVVDTQLDTGEVRHDDAVTRGGLQ